MVDIPLTRSRLLLPFVGILDGMGAPTTSLLEKFRLPSALEEKGDLYVPLLPALDFVHAAQRAQGIDDFGFAAARQLHFAHLNERTRGLVAHSPTLLVALRHACRLASREDTILTMWLERHGDHARICSRLGGTGGFLHLKYVQWIQNIFAIHIVRQFTGPGWMPPAIAFESDYTPSPATQACWPNARFLSGQPSAWISVPIAHLGLPNRAAGLFPPPPDHEEGASGRDLVDLLKLMLPAYLDQGAPTLPDIADMAGVSPRTFQRRLSAIGLAYSDILDTVRYDHASRLLRDTDAKIIEVAFSSGYADPAHFSRAFRRIAGVTPRRFRQQSRPR